jgi:hypothetical protein
VRVYLHVSAALPPRQTAPASIGQEAERIPRAVLDNANKIKCFTPAGKRILIRPVCRLVPALTELCRLQRKYMQFYNSTFSVCLNITESSGHSDTDAWGKKKEVLLPIFHLFLQKRSRRFGHSRRQVGPRSTSSYHIGTLSKAHYSEDKRNNFLRNVKPCDIRDAHRRFGRKKMLSLISGQNKWQGTPGWEALSKPFETKANRRDTRGHSSPSCYIHIFPPFSPSPSALKMETVSSSESK